MRTLRFMKQRLGIADVLLKDPQIVIMSCSSAAFRFLILQSVPRPHW